MKRIIHKYLPTVIATVLIMACVMGTIWVRFSGSKAWKSEASVAQVFVKKGDTLWSIAEKYKPREVGIREYIREVKDLNEMNGSTLIAGEVIEVFVFED